MKNVLFSINEHDNEGNVSVEGLYLHFGDTRIRVGDGKAELQDLIDRLHVIMAEVVDDEWHDIKP